MVNMLNNNVISSPRPLLIFCGGPVAVPDLSLGQRIADQAVAADGGARHAAEFSGQLLAVIGDMDSITPEDRARYSDRLIEVTDQDSTDFDKVLARVDAPYCVVLGAGEGRFDHALAVCASLVGRPQCPAIVLGTETVTVLCPPRIDLDLPAETDLSLFPMGPVTCASKGLQWPTDGLALAPDGRIATSNRALGPVSLTPSGPKLLLILPRLALDPLIAALGTAPRWTR